MSSKYRKRRERLSRCVKTNDVDRLSSYLQRKKYSKLDLDEAVVNKRGETLLHLACRLIRPHVVELLTKLSLGEPTSRDLKGNTPLHTALIAVMQINDSHEYQSAYRRLILAHLKDLSASLGQPNLNGQTAKDLLDLADSIYQHHTARTGRRGNGSVQDEEQEWRNKLAAEMDDEYSCSWGKYEADFQQPDLDEAETYDTWAERMIREHKKRLRAARNFNAPPQSKPEVKPSWTPEDQQRFLREEESRRQLQKAAEEAEKRFQFLFKLQSLVRSDSEIKESDLPFSCSEDVKSIGQIILLHVNEQDQVDAKRKALRELQRLWHPDKFSQKFSQRLSATIRDKVLAKVTEISQYLNAFSCSLESEK